MPSASPRLALPRLLLPRRWMRGSSPRMTGAHRSCGLLQNARHGRGAHVADFLECIKDSLPSVLERHLGRNVRLACTGIERGDQRSVAFGNEAPAHFLGAGDLAVVGVELLVQNQEPADLRANHGLLV